MVIVHVLHNIGVNKSVSESITEDSHRVNGKFIITIIGKNGSLHHCIHTVLKYRYLLINIEYIIFFLISLTVHILYML